jgi:hypothetical protein
VFLVPSEWQLRDRSAPEDWPFPPNEFVRASRLVEDGATDQEVRHAVERVEDGDRA